jgi:hypothetical protein
MISATLDRILADLLSRYRERVADVGHVISAMLRRELVRDAADIEDDHVAFRTLGVPLLGIGSIERIFTHHGYRRRDSYFFADKKLDAIWLSPPEERLPRIFISELRIGDLSPEMQRILTSYTNEVTKDPLAGINLDDAEAVDAFLHRPLWRLPTVEDYETLLAESEYAAWAVYNRYYLNHFTIAVHTLPPGYNTIAEFNAFLESEGIILNDAGGKIKTSADGLLLQSSTVAQIVEAEFAGGARRPIPGSYVEFAERRPLPQYAHLPAAELHRSHRRDGFETANADKIFESTFAAQTGRRGEMG